MVKNIERPVVESLVQLGQTYRHVQQEHHREAAGSATRHKLELDMQEVTQRFERLLTHWVEDPALRDAWTSYLHHGGPPPGEPRIATPPTFRGVTETGSRIEVRPSDDGGYDVVVDGTIVRHEAVPWALDADVIEPSVIAERACREIGEAPPEAVRALAAFLATPHAEPPWQWMRTLFEDGWIDEQFALTARGYRLLGKGAPRPVGAPTPTTFGILAADAARARVFILRATGGTDAPTLAPLIETAESTNPAERARDSELLSDTRPGLHREGPDSPRHAVDDRRERHRREIERRFAKEIAEEATRLWHTHGVTHAVVVASPGMLGLLRPALSRAGGIRAPWSTRELARDLTRLAPAALHDVLASSGFVPARGRMPAQMPSPGMPT